VPGPDDAGVPDDNSLVSGIPEHARPAVLEVLSPKTPTKLRQQLLEELERQSRTDELPEWNAARIPVLKELDRRKLRFSTDAAPKGAEPRPEPHDENGVALGLGATPPEPERPLTPGDFEPQGPGLWQPNASERADGMREFRMPSQTKGYRPEDHGKERRGWKGFESYLQPYWFEPPRPPDRPADAETQKRLGPGVINRPTEQQSRAEADMAWQDELERAKHEGYAIHRYKDEEDGLKRFAGAIIPTLTSLAHAYGEGMDFGIPGRVAGAVLGPEARERTEQIAQSPDLPLLSYLEPVTEFGSLMHGSSATNKVVGGVMRAAGATKKGAGPIRRLVTAATGAAADQGVRAGGRSAGDAAEQVLHDGPGQTQTLGEVGENMRDAAMYTVPFMLPFEAMQALGRWRVNKLRTHPDIGPKIRRVEGQGGGTDFWNGVNPPPEVKGVQDELANTRAAGVGDIANNPDLLESPMSATDVLRKRAVDELGARAIEHREALPKEMAATNSAYLGSPQGTAENVTAQSIVDRLRQRIATGQDSTGRELPARELEADRRVLAEFLRPVQGPPASEADAMHLEDARKYGMPVDDEAIARQARELVEERDMLLNPRLKTVATEGRTQRVVSEPGKEVQTPEERGEDILQSRLDDFEGPFYDESPPRGDAAEEPRYASVRQLREQGHQLNTEPLEALERRRIEKEGRITVEPRTMSPAQIEETIKRYKDAVADPNVRRSDVSTQGEILPELYKLREQYPFNAAAPSPRGGFGRIKQGQELDMENLETMLQAFRTNPKMDDLSMQDRTLVDGLHQFVHTLNAEGVPPHLAYDAVIKFIKPHETLQKLLDTHIASRDYDNLMRRTEVAPVRITAGARGISGYIGQAATGPGAAVRLDPIAQRMGGVERPIPKPLEPQGYIEDTRAFRAGRGIRSAGEHAVRVLNPLHVSQDDIAAQGGRDELHLGARAVVKAPKRPNTPVELFPDKVHGTGKGAARAARAGSAAASHRNAVEDARDVLDVVGTMAGGKRKPRKKDKR